MLSSQASSIGRCLAGVYLSSRREISRANILMILREEYDWKYFTFGTICDMKWQVPRLLNIWGVKNFSVKRGKCWDFHLERLTLFIDSSSRQQQRRRWGLFLRISLFLRLTVCLAGIPGICVWWFFSLWEEKAFSAPRFEFACAWAVKLLWLWGILRYTCLKLILKQMQI